MREVRVVLLGLRVPTARMTSSGVKRHSESGRTCSEASPKICLENVAGRLGQQLHGPLDICQARSDSCQKRAAPLEKFSACPISIGSLLH